MQTAGFSRPGYFTGPDVQAVRLLAMQLQPLEALLYPLPVLLALLLGQRADLRMLLRIALEYAGADQVGGAARGMHERFRVVDDEPAGSDALFQPCLLYTSPSPRD